MLRYKHMQVTVGIDEVGRGSWAGPLVAAAVLLPQPVAGLKDSKLLTAHTRRLLAKEIRQNSFYGIGWVWPVDIDANGLTQAVSDAMRQALSGITSAYDRVVIDGNYNFLKNIPGTITIIKADNTVAEVSAASILAKVARDTYMAEKASMFPAYGFDRNVGYGTRQHIAALNEFGPCELHRLSYKPLKALV